MAKVGRKRFPYITSWGESIDGLARLTDGRGVDQDDRAHPWVSADERTAIKEFRKRRAERGREQIGIQIACIPWAQLEADIEKAITGGGRGRDRDQRQDQPGRNHHHFADVTFPGSMGCLCQVAPGESQAGG